MFFLIQAGNRVSAGLPLPTDHNLIVSLAKLLISNKNRFCSLAKMIKGKIVLSHACVDSTDLGGP